MADTSSTALRIIEEGTFGTTPTTPTMQELRFTGESLGFNIESSASDEIRPDRQVPDLVQMSAQSAGAVNFEYSAKSYDDTLIKGLMGADWSAVVTVTATTISAASSDNSYNDSGSGFGSLTAGQWVKVSGFATAANNGYAKVVSVAAGKIVVAGPTLVDEAAGESVTVKNDGTVQNGTTRYSYSIEREQTDESLFKLFKGMRVGQMDLTVAAGEFVGGSFNFMGLDMAPGTATAAAGKTAASTTEILSPVANVANIRAGGSPLAGTFIRSLNLSLNANLRASPAIGNLAPVKIGLGRFVVTGTMELYLEDNTFLDLYKAGTASSLDFKLEDNAGNAQIVTLPRIKFSGEESQSPGNDQDVIQSLPFQAILDPTLGKTVQIDRFNA